MQTSRGVPVPFKIGCSDGCFPNCEHALPMELPPDHALGAALALRALSDGLVKAIEALEEIHVLGKPVAPRGVLLQHLRDYIYTVESYRIQLADYLKHQEWRSAPQELTPGYKPVEERLTVDRRADEAAPGGVAV